jgi:hypothetical protein
MASLWSVPGPPQVYRELTLPTRFIILGGDDNGQLLVITLLVYNGQNSADEVKQIVMTQSPVCHPIGTGLGLRTMITLRRERHMWTVPQACQATPSKACRAASAITGTR